MILDLVRKGNVFSVPFLDSNACWEEDRLGWIFQLENLIQKAEMSQLCKAFPSNSFVLHPQVPLLLHQKQALAWLLWRESQRPCGGILGKQQNRRVDWGVDTFMAATVRHITYLEANN